MKKSAGILVYKKENDEIKVLLCHFGGPYLENVNKGGWSLSKGEMTNNEKILDTAKREFNEETNLELNSNIQFLASKKVSRNKLVVMFYSCSDFDITNCKSNTFELEYPRGSGKIKNFPEMDKYEWMDIKKAKEMIIYSQLYFLNKLEEKITSSN